MKLVTSVPNPMTRQTMKEIVELSDKTITTDRNEFLKVQGCIDTNLYYVEGGRKSSKTTNLKPFVAYQRF